MRPSSRDSKDPETAVITGSGMEELFHAEEERRVRVGSKYVTVYRCGQKGSFFFLPRHLRDHSIPPHKIDFSANLRALKQLGVRRVVATSAVGSISENLKVGNLGLVDQFIDFSKRRVTAFEDDSVHVDMTSPYDPGLQRSLLSVAKRLGLPLARGLVYVSVDGPRYETSAEIRMFALMGGDVVGMTGAPETIVARELGMRYASVVVATNRAAGLQSRVSHDEVISAMKRARPKLEQLILGTIAE